MCGLILHGVKRHPP